MGFIGTPVAMHLAGMGYRLRVLVARAGSGGKSHRGRRDWEIT
jgi:hypothetical protein